MSGRAARLAGLLRVRQLQERAARAEVLRAAAEAERAQEAARRRLSEYETEEKLVSVDAETWRELRASREAQAASVRSLYSVARSARQAEVTNREAWTATNQRVQVTDKLVDTVAEREAKELERAAQRVTDDLTGARWVAQQTTTETPTPETSEEDE